MNFSASLARIVDKVEGSLGAVILGIDGIVIERYVNDLDPALDLDLIATEFTTLLRRAMHTAADTELGALGEMAVKTAALTLVFRPITAEYFLMLVLRPEGNVGRARFELRKTQIALESEFSI